MILTPTQIAFAAVLVLSGTAFAQTAAPAAEPAASPLSFNVSLTSNYKFRGQDQDQSKTRRFKPALQGGVDYAFANGFYVGNWNSTVDWTKYLPSDPNNKLEVDLYGGYKFKAGVIDLDVGALTYYYPGASGANTAGIPDYTDYSVGAAYDLGYGLALSGAVVGANKKSSFLFPAAVDSSGKSINKGTLVVMLTKTL